MSTTGGVLDGGISPASGPAGADKANTQVSSIQGRWDGVPGTGLHPDFGSGRDPIAHGLGRSGRRWMDSETIPIVFLGGDVANGPLAWMLFEPEE